MAFKGITFAGQNVTPKNDGGLYRAHYGDGILWGCSMAISGDDLVIQSGEFIAGGRVCFVDGATNIDLSTRVNTNGYIQVIMNYDLSQGEGSQWYTTFVESATTTFPVLTQDDINNTDTLYQYQLAIVQVSGGNLTSLYWTATASNIVGNRNINLVGEETQLLMYDSDGTPSAFFGVWESDSFCQIGKRANDGTVVAGTRYFESGTDSSILFGNGGDLKFRPNGVTNATGQMWLDKDGQLHGGHPRTTNNITASVNVSASTTKEIGHVQAPKNGVYLIFLTGDFNPDASFSGTVRFGIGFTSATTQTIINSHYSSGGAHVYTAFSCVAALNAGDYVYFNVWSPTAGKVTGSINIFDIN